METAVSIELIIFFNLFGKLLVEILSKLGTNAVLKHLIDLNTPLQQQTNNK